MAKGCDSNSYDYLGFLHLKYRNPRQQEITLAKKGEMFTIAAKKVNLDFKKKRMNEVFRLN